MSSAIVSPTITASPARPQPIEHGAEDRAVRLRLAMRVRRQHGVGEMPWCATNSSRSRDEFESSPIFRPRPRSVVEHGQRVVVELEVRRVRPASLHLDRGRVRVPRAAHADDDPLGEQHPDLLVVVELGMPLHLRERGGARLLVAAWVEVEPVAEPERAVAVRAEVGPGTASVKSTSKTTARSTRRG